MDVWTGKPVNTASDWTGHVMISCKNPGPKPVLFVSKAIINTCSMKQPDLYYFETIKMTSQALLNFVWRIQAAGEYSL